MNDFWITWQPKILSLLRIITGFLFMWHGIQKFFNFPPSEKWASPQGIMLVGAFLELGGGLLIFLGLFTRWTAFILSGMMAFAYWGWHVTNPQTWEAKGGLTLLPMVNGGELAVLYCFVFLYLFFAGGGSLSLDNLLKKKEV